MPGCEKGLLTSLPRIAGDKAGLHITARAAGGHRRQLLLPDPWDSDQLKAIRDGVVKSSTGTSRSGSRFGGLPSAISSSIHSNGHQLRSGISLGHYDFVLQPQGLFDAPPPLIQLPAPLFIGSTSIRGSSTHFGKVTQPDGVMLQLGQRSSERDVWLWLPSGTSHNQASPWSSATSLSHWRECNELHFITSLPPVGMQLITGSADFIRHFPPMALIGGKWRWWRGNGRWTEAALQWPALTAGGVSGDSTPERAADVLEQQQQVQRIGG